MTKDEQAVWNAVMNFLDSYAQKSIDGCMSAIVVSRPILLFGTNENEVFKTSEEVRCAFGQDFESMTGIRWGEHRNRHIAVDSTIAGVLVELPIAYQCEGNTVETLFRYALTLTKEGDRWKICSGMASVPFMAGTYEFTQ